LFQLTTACIKYMCSELFKDNLVEIQSNLIPKLDEKPKLNY
jgi:hypothetical protein